MDATRARALAEPVAAAVRSADHGRLLDSAAEVRMCKEYGARCDLVPEDGAWLAGFTEALEAVLDAAISTSEMDGLVEFVKERRHRVPVLHTLAQLTKESVASSAEDRESAPAVAMAVLADRVGVLPQNISTVLEGLVAKRLIRVTRRGPEKRARLTQLGLDVLEAIMPTWSTLETRAIPSTTPSKAFSTIDYSDIIFATTYAERVPGRAISGRTYSKPEPKVA